MRIPREVRRTVAQFLNGVAIAVLVAGTISPLVAGDTPAPSMVVTAATALALHSIAIALTAWR